MADIKQKTHEEELAEVIRAVNVQARLLGEIVKAADHIVKAYVELTTPPKKEEVVDVKAETVEETKQ